MEEKKANSLITGRILVNFQQFSMKRVEIRKKLKKKEKGKRASNSLSDL